MVHIDPTTIDTSEPTHRLRVRADGRCAVRAVLTAARAPTPPDVHEVIATADSPAARDFIRETRCKAVTALMDRMSADDDLDCVVRGSFPDERFDSFEEWVEAQQSDDTKEHVSELWQGGGQWLIYGLALTFRLQIFVHTIEVDGCLSGPAVELVDARPADERATTTMNTNERGDLLGMVVRLAAVRGATGDFFHFDALVDSHRGELEGAEPLPTPTSAAAASSSSSSAVASFGFDLLSPAASSRSARLLAWTALNVLVLAVCLDMPPRGPDEPPLATQLAALLQNLMQQMAQQLVASPVVVQPPAAPVLLFEEVGLSHLPDAGMHTMIMPPVPEIVIVQ